MTTLIHDVSHCGILSYVDRKCEVACSIWSIVINATNKFIFDRYEE